MQIMNIVPKNSRHVVIVAYRRATYNHSSFFETIHSWFAIVDLFFQNRKFFDAFYRGVGTGGAKIARATPVFLERNFSVIWISHLFYSREQKYTHAY